MARTPKRASRAKKAVATDPVKETGEQKYSINLEALVASGKSPSYLISTRLCGRCPACAKATSPGQAFMRSPSDLMKQIAGSCSKEPAYLLPGTPVTEAVFRLMLASNNRPMTVSEIQGGLTQAWASVIYLKNLNDDVIRRLVNEPNEYRIGPVPEK